MRALKILGIVVAIYVAIVVIFESLLGYSQPQNEGTLVLTVTADDATDHSRVLSRIDLGDRLYVAVNHWPRAWYHHLLQRPEVEVDSGSGAVSAIAVPVEDPAERAEVEAARPLGLVFRILTGFPPRHFVRLDTVMAIQAAPDPGAVSTMPLILEDPKEVADIKMLDTAIEAVSAAVMTCVSAGDIPAEQCHCQFQDLVDEARAAYAVTVATHPDWEGQSVLWWKDDSRSYSYNLNMPGIARQLDETCP